MDSLESTEPSQQPIQQTRCLLNIQTSLDIDADYVCADKNRSKASRNAAIVIAILTGATMALYLLSCVVISLIYPQMTPPNQDIPTDNSLTVKSVEVGDFVDLDAFLKYQEEFYEGSVDLSLTKGYSWEEQLYELPLKVSYDMMLQNEDGTILMSLYSKTKHSFKQTDSTIDLDAVSWQVSDKSTSSLIRTKLFYEIPPQLNTGEVVLQRGKIYQIDCVLSEKRVAQFIDGQRVTIALISPDEIPMQGHIGFGIMGHELMQPALVGNIMVEHLTDVQAQSYLTLDIY